MYFRLCTEILVNLFIKLNTLDFGPHFLKAVEGLINSIRDYFDALFSQWLFALVFDI